jgi:hypothetical protein
VAVGVAADEGFARFSRGVASAPHGGTELQIFAGHHGEDEEKLESGESCGYEQRGGQRPEVGTQEVGRVEQMWPVPAEVQAPGGLETGLRPAWL